MTDRSTDPDACLKALEAAGSPLALEIAHDLRRRRAQNASTCAEVQGDGNKGTGVSTDGNTAPEDGTPRPPVCPPTPSVPEESADAIRTRLAKRREEFVRARAEAERALSAHGRGSEEYEAAVGSMDALKAEGNALRMRLEALGEKEEA